MKFILRYVSFIVLSAAFCTCKAEEKAMPVITPTPVRMAVEEGRFAFSPSTVIVTENEAQAAAARYFTRLFSLSAGFSPAVKIGGGGGDVRFVSDSRLESEAYELSVSSGRIVIRASDVKGFFYALQTLRLALPSSVDAAETRQETWSVPAMTVYDKPRFAYRGLMLDVARFFMPKEDLLKVIDCMAMLKLNSLHLHLTDDNGWRIEIKKYPKLTEVGAWRVDRGNLPFPERRNPEPNEQASVGGFYTQEDMKEIISYAAERQIEIIPEIDVPAHSNAALAAYPRYACPVVKKFIGVLPGLGGSNADIIYCAGNEETFRFLEGVFDEIAGLFPSKYIHIGGDEAKKTNWKRCPLCQARMHKEKLADEEALQGYFMGRIARYIRQKGKEVMGWDELTNSTLPDSVVVFGWQGYGNAALKAAELGHRFVMTPARVLYFIRYQGPQWFEPLTYFGNNTLKDVYDYEPVRPDWKPEYESRLMGVQGSMWTEFCNTSDEVTYQIFPRLAALAEVAWSPKGAKNWEAFLKALDNFDAHLDAKGIVYAKSMYNIQHVSVPDRGRVKVSLECIRPDVEIRYTLDGTMPSANSALYTGTLTFSGKAGLKAATFKDGRPMGKVLTLPVVWSMSTGKPVVNAKGNERLLTNGVRGSLRQSDFEWCTWDGLQGASFTIDLGSSREVSVVKVGCLTNYSMAVNKPRTISVAISEDGKSFQEVGEKAFSDREIFKEGNFVEDIAFPVKPAAVRFIRIKATNPGICPENHVRPGQQSHFCFDEITVN